MCLSLTFPARLQAKDTHEASCLLDELSIAQWVPEWILHTDLTESHVDSEVAVEGQPSYTGTMFPRVPLLFGSRLELFESRICVRLEGQNEAQSLSLDGHLGQTNTEVSALPSVMFLALLPRCRQPHRPPSRKPLPADFGAGLRENTVPQNWSFPQTLLPTIIFPLPLSFPQMVYGFSDSLFGIPSRTFQLLFRSSLPQLFLCLLINKPLIPHLTAVLLLRLDPISSESSWHTLSLINHSALVSWCAQWGSLTLGVVLRMK